MMDVQETEESHFLFSLGDWKNIFPISKYILVSVCSRDQQLMHIELPSENKVLVIVGSSSEDEGPTLISDNDERMIENMKQYEARVIFFLSGNPEAERSGDFEGCR